MGVVANPSTRCHGTLMRDNRGKQAQAGGAVLAFSIVIGAAVGVILRQPSIGVLTGTGCGLLLLLLIWYRDRS